MRKSESEPDGVREAGAPDDGDERDQLAAPGDARAARVRRRRRQEDVVLELLADIAVEVFTASDGEPIIGSDQ